MNELEQAIQHNSVTPALIASALSITTQQLRDKTAFLPSPNVLDTELAQLGQVQTALAILATPPAAPVAEEVPAEEVPAEPVAEEVPADDTGKKAAK